MGKARPAFAPTAGDIDKALAVRHKDDLYVPECKTGQTLKGSHRRLDAWVMARSYSPFRTIGYEIKVDRGDFVQDQKWVEYLDYCHYFYFVCPAGLIKSHELPDDAGLLWMTPSGRLHDKKRATRREPDADKLRSILVYVLMSRCRVGSPADMANGGVSSFATTPQEKLSLRRSSVEAAAARKELASFVSGHVRQVWNDAAERLREARDIERSADDVRALLAEHGIRLDDPVLRYRARAKLSDALGISTTDDVLASLENAERTLHDLRERVAYRLKCLDEKVAANG
jgi:hypothetical protein